MDSKELIDKALEQEFLSASEGQYLFSNTNHNILKLCKIIKDSRK